MNGQHPLVVHVIFRLDYGGLENGLVNLVNRLSEAGQFRQALVVLTEATAFAARVRPGVPIYALGKRPGKDPASYVRLFRLLRELRPLVVHTRNIGTLDCALVAFLAGVPVRVHGEHGWDVFDPDGNRVKYRALRRIFSPFVHCFVAVSEHLRHWLVTAVRIRASKVKWICNGVDTDKFRPATSADRLLLPRDVFPAGSLVIGSITRFSAIKDPMNLIEAFIRLRADPEVGGSLRLLMIGDGALRDAALRRLREAGADGRAWLPGSRDDVDALLRCMDVFVLGSLREGISNTVLEAMSSGLAVVATATGGNTELVATGETGELVPPADPGALAAAVKAYAQDAERRYRHGRNARAAAIAKFSISAMIEQYRRVYEEAVHVGGSAALPRRHAEPPAGHGEP